MDEPVKHVAQQAPLWALAGGASLAGGIAQAGVTLALGMSYSLPRFIGFVVVSMVISGGLTVLLAEGLHLSPLVSAVVGALTGTIPSLIVVRAALQKLLEKYEVELGESSLDLLEPAPPERAVKGGGTKNEP